jgi:hypothetical protein
MRDDFRDLLRAPRDLWVVYGVKLIESIAYFAIAMFLAKTPVGFVGGALIFNYCAENAVCESEPIWLIVFASTIAGPIIALLFSGFIRAAEHAKAAEDNRDPVEF